MKSETLSRIELYNLVWSEPLLRLSKRFNISDNGLRKICIRMKIPLPKSGHWQKVEHGKRVRIIELPADYSGEKEVTLEVITEESIRKTTITEEIKKLQLQIESEMKEQLLVPEKLTKPDDLVRVTRERFAATAKRDWSSRVFKDYPDELNINVAVSNEPRALRFFDTLIKALRFRKHNVIAEHRVTKAILFGEKIEIRLKEKDKIIREIKNGFTNTEYEPTGILYFAIKAGWSDKLWTDGNVLIEQQLSNIIAYLEVKGKQLQQETIEREIRWKEEEEKKKLKRALEERQDQELNEFKLLLSKVERWKKMKFIRGYIDELEAKSKEIDLHEDIKEWIDWAKKKADWYDPHTNSPDELLKDLDRETLTFRNRSSYY